MVRSKIRNKWLLVGLLGCTQVLVLVGGVLWFGYWGRDSIHQLIREQVLIDNTSIAGQMTRLIELMDIRDLSPQSDDWERLQTAVESIVLPNEGFICIVHSENGKLVCHPQLRRNPQLADMAPGLEPLISARGSSPIVTSHGRGWAQMPDGTHLIAVRDLPGLRAKVLVHQKDTGVRAAVGQLLIPAEQVGWGVALMTPLLGVLAAALVVLRYENRLAETNEQLEETVRLRTNSLVKTRNAVIFGLAKLAEYRDNDTGKHLDRIREYVSILAQRLRRHCREIDNSYIANLGLASSLHDIGKVAIPDAILLKPGRLNAEERSVMERHVHFGAECLAAIKDQLGSDDFLQMAHDIALCHHERVDGKGYPSGLRGEQIPLAARIVSLADVYDALRSRRVYKEPMSHAEACRIITEGAGTQFHPLIVDCFLAVERQFEQVSERHGLEETTAPAEAEPLLAISL